MYNYVDFIVKFDQDRGEILTGLNFLEWLCDFRRAYV